ncbi:MAG TPA: G1 family glutamic endopeptidase [Solirubrobacteraceae bacterium]|jgi:hypothetical protein|nr:G1 family glutamic endopeptidase [Solirubrobacteraceae bacterium]
MTPRHLLPALAIGALGAAVLVSTSSSTPSGERQTASSGTGTSLIDEDHTVGTVATQAAASENWAGYTVGGQNFSHVSGSWVQPGTSCSSGQGSVAYWVGIGGASEQSQALEQVGTETDCNSGGSSTTFAWYELVPSAPVRLPVSVHAGDHISAAVSVDGTSVTVTLTDHTTGKSATRQLTMSDPDTSSAEWITEAPSQCSSDLSQCQPVPLSDFGSVTFTDASATAGGHTGSISDSGWQAEPMQLASGIGGGRFFGRGSGFFGGGGVAAGDGQAAGGSAVPSTLVSDGSSFSVSWENGDEAQASGTPSPSSSSSSPSGGTGAQPSVVVVTPTGGYGGYGGGYGTGGYGGYGGYGAGGYGAGGYGGYGYGGGFGGYGGYGGY